MRASRATVGQTRSLRDLRGSTTEGEGVDFPPVELRLAQERTATTKQNVGRKSAMFFFDPHPDLQCVFSFSKVEWRQQQRLQQQRRHKSCGNARATAVRQQRNKTSSSNGSNASSSSAATVQQQRQEQQGCRAGTICVRRLARQYNTHRAACRLSHLVTLHRQVSFLADGSAVWSAAGCRAVDESIQ